MNEFEELVVCPYNKAHSIRKGRLQVHLAKCRVQFGTSEISTCPFNSTHHVPTAELRCHQAVCPNRLVIDSFIYQVKNAECPVKDTVPIDQITLPPSEENWDDDGAVQGVSVLESIKQKAKEKPVLLNIIGAPKAERKAHRHDERMRHMRAMQGNKNEVKENPESSKPLSTQVNRPTLVIPEVRMPKKYLQESESTGETYLQKQHSVEASTSYTQPRYNIEGVISDKIEKLQISENRKPTVAMQLASRPAPPQVASKSEDRPVIMPISKRGRGGKRK